MKGSEFVFDYIRLLYYKCHNIYSKYSGSYIHSSDWIKNQNAAINLINKKDSKCFQYVVTLTLNYEEIKKDPQRITRIKPLINKYNWNGINFPSVKDDWKKLRK